MIIPRPSVAVSIAVLGPADAKLFLRSTGNPEGIPPDCLKGKAYAQVRAQIASWMGNIAHDCW